MMIKRPLQRCLSFTITVIALLWVAHLAGCGGSQMGGMFISKFDSTAVCDSKIKLLRMRNDSDSEMKIKGASIDSGTDPNGNFKLVSLFIGEQEICSDLGAIEQITADEKCNPLSKPEPLPSIPANSTYTWKIEFSPTTKNSVHEAMLNIAYESPPGVVQVQLEGASGDAMPGCVLGSLSPGAGGGGGSGGSSVGTTGTGGSGGTAGTSGTGDSGGSGGTTGGAGGTGGSAGTGGSGGSAGSGETCTGTFADYCGEMDITIDKLRLVTEQSPLAVISSDKAQPAYTPYLTKIQLLLNGDNIFPSILNGFILPPPGPSAGKITDLVHHFTQVIVEKEVTGTFDRNTGDMNLPSLSIRLISDVQKTDYPVADGFDARMNLSLTTKGADTAHITQKTLKDDKFKASLQAPPGKAGQLLGTPLDPKTHKVVLVGVSPGFFPGKPGADKIGSGQLAGNMLPPPNGEAAVEITVTIKTKTPGQP